MLPLRVGLGRMGNAGRSRCSRRRSPRLCRSRKPEAASIFAYGQTSCGKTYTMTGITEYTMEDLYEFISKHDERAFVLKFSAVEIYNEVVKDLLNPERFLDISNTTRPARSSLSGARTAMAFSYGILQQLDYILVYCQPWFLPELTQQSRRSCVPSGD